MPRIELLQPSCNPATLKDGRGGIFTWVPPEPIREFNLVTIFPGKKRGDHYHQHFVEYLLFVEGEGAVVWRESPVSTEEHVIHVAAGSALRVEIGAVHTSYPIGAGVLKFVAMLTKPWDECTPPIIPVPPVG